MNYTFSNLLGAPYRGGSLLIDGDCLLCPAGNRVREVQLREATSQTLPIQHPNQIQALALSPDGSLLLSVDVSGKAFLVLRARRVLLHRFSLKGPAAAAKFSPDGRFIAIAVGRLLQVWKTPSKQKMVAPMQLHRTYGGCHDDITSVAWSPDSRWLAVASKDITAKVFSLDPIPGYIVPTLTGHRNAVVAIFFAAGDAAGLAALSDAPPPAVYTVSSDGALHAYSFAPRGDGAAAKRGRGEGEGGGSDDSDGDDGPPEELAVGGDDSDGEEGEGRFAARGGAASGSGQGGCDFAHGVWKLSAKHYFDQNHCRLTCADYHGPTGMLVTAFSTGQFLLHRLPEFEHIQTLSISRDRISAVAFNATGEWVCLGCATLGQLLVWEWRSETYVLKQQGHYYDVSTVAFSPDGTYLATGADDSKVKIWAVASGYCFVTFSEHRAAVTAVRFLPSSHAVVSASLDGTVRAFDLVRYRNFRTMTSPEPVQFVCVAVDGAGEVVCAGSRDTFQLFVWSLKTGKLLNVLSGHEGPVVDLAFSTSDSVVASASWDKTARLWDIYSGERTATDILQHSHEVLAVAFDPSGRNLVASTLDGELAFWDAPDAAMRGVIEARRDIRGGRLMSDRRAAGNMASGQAFTSLAYSADGTFLIAGGTSKWVCVYDVEEKVLLRRFQLSKNYALDGVLDQLNSRNVTDAGPLDQLEVDVDDDAVLPPAVAGGAAGADKLPGTAGGQKKAVLRCRGLALSGDGHAWAAATTEGILLYSLDAAVVFDPTDLSEDISVPSVHRLVGRRSLLKAALVVLRLNDRALTAHVLMHAPVTQIPVIASALPAAAVVPVLAALAGALEGGSPHVGFILTWARSLFEFHGDALAAAPRGQVMPLFRSMHKALQELQSRLGPSVEQCLYQLSYLDTVSALPKPVDAL